MKIEKKFDS